MPLDFFYRNQGKTIIRNGPNHSSIIRITNSNHARWLFELQKLPYITYQTAPGEEYEEVEPIGNTCVACEG